MVKIMTGGVGKTEVANQLKSLTDPGDTVEVGTDMDAALKLRTGKLDYYFGTCHTGAGASLGVLVGLLGTDKCHTFGRSVPSPEDVTKAVASGAVAFGFSVDQIEQVVPLLWSAITNR